MEEEERATVKILKQAEFVALKAHKAKSTCTEWFLTLVDAKNFVLCWYPSLTVQDVEISREDELSDDDGEKRWVTAWSGSGIGPVES